MLDVANLGYDSVCVRVCVHTCDVSSSYAIDLMLHWIWRSLLLRHLQVSRSVSLLPATPSSVIAHPFHLINWSSLHCLHSTQEPTFLMKSKASQMPRVWITRYGSKPHLLLQIGKSHVYTCIKDKFLVAYFESYSFDPM